MLIDVDVILRGEADDAWCQTSAQTVLTQPGFSMLSLVEELGPALTSLTTTTRKAGVNLLSCVLAQPGVVASLVQEEVAVVTMFYNDRLRDHHSLLPPTLHGLSLVTASSLLAVEQVEQVLTSLQNEVMVQQQLVRDRAVVFNMLASLLRDKEELLTSLATLYTLTLCQAGEGETDPRNLLVIFSTKVNILNSLSVKHLREEIHESLAVYFPVDFSPPSGVPGSVTKEQLVTALRSGLAHSSLTEWSLPLVLEKLDSDLESAKLESLELLLSLLQSGQEEEEVVTVWRDQVSQVWAGLRQELLGIRASQPGSRVVRLAGRAITEVSRALLCRGGVWAAEWREVWLVWWREVWAACRPGLDQPRTSLITSAGLVLSSVSQAGSEQAQTVLSHLLPLLAAKTSLTRAELELVDNILQAATSQELHLSLTEELQGWLDSLFTLLLSLLSQQTEAAMVLARSASLLTTKQVGELREVLLAEVRKDRKEVGPAVAELLRTRRELVEVEMLPRILESLNTASLECLVQCLQVGGVYRLILTTVVDSLTAQQQHRREEILRKLAQFNPGQRDLLSIEDRAADLLLVLLRDLSPSWPESDSEDFCKILSDLSSSLSASSWLTVQPAVTGGQLSVMSSSVLTSVSSSIVASWPPHFLTDLLSQPSPLTWPLLASVVNKAPAAALSLSSSPLLPTTAQAVGQICLGLVRRGDGSGADWLDRLLSLLDQEEGGEGEEAARQVPRLLEPICWRHGVTGLLYKQRLWQQIFPRLSQHSGPHHTAALVSCFPHLPPAILSASLPAVMPRVISALSSNSTCHPALVCLDTITRQSPALVSSHLTELVHHCLRTSQEATQLTTRVLALSVLAHCAHMEGATTVQLATTVTRDLRRVVSDKKRLVRLEAAKTRNKWFLVTQPS